MQKALILIFLLCLTKMGAAQFISASGTQLSTSASSVIGISTTGNVAVTSDLATAKVDLELKGSSQTLNGDLVLRKLTLNGSGTKTLNNQLTITEGIDFILGIVAASTSGKILYTGAKDGIAADETNDLSYVDGIFYNQSSGPQLYPVGASGLGYAPASLTTGRATQEIGIQVINQSPNFVMGSDSEIKKLDNTHYWEVNATDLGSQINLSLKGVDPTLAQDKGLSLAVVQGDKTGDIVDGLGGTPIGTTSVTSQTPFTKSLLGIGASEEVIVTVVDMITPKVDTYNDYLKIINIEKFDIRKVTLLDRYGFNIHEWPSGFTNCDDPANPCENNFDYSKLVSGSYICIVEYGNANTAMQKIQQMISVINN